MYTRYLSLAFLMFLFMGCENMNELPSAPTPSVGLSNYEVEMEGSTIDVVVTSDKEVTVAEKPEWVTETNKSVSYNKYIFTFRVSSNMSLEQRNGEIKFNTGEKPCAVNIIQEAYPAYVPSTSLAGLEEIIEKMELEIVGKAVVNGQEYDKKGYAHSERVTAPFYRVWDGITASNPFYSVQESINNLPAGYWPVRLDLYLPENTSVLDHVKYYTTTNNVLGAWGEVELWVSRNPEDRDNKDETGFEKVGELDCGFQWKTQFDIPATIGVTGVRTVRLIVKNAMDNGSTICVSANQLEVYGQLPFDFSATDLFTDNSCSVLKNGIDADDIADYPFPMFRNLAHYLRLGLYPQERIITVNQATASTNIRVTDGQTLVVMIESSENNSIELDILNTTDGAAIATYPLSPGINLLKNCKSGGIQLRYTGSTPAKLNFLNGEVIQ